MNGRELYGAIYSGEKLVHQAMAGNTSCLTSLPTMRHGGNSFGNSEKKKGGVSKHRLLLIIYLKY